MRCMDSFRVRIWFKKHEETINADETAHSLTYTPDHTKTKKEIKLKEKENNGFSFKTEYST